MNEYIEEPQKLFFNGMYEGYLSNKPFCNEIYRKIEDLHLEELISQSRIIGKSDIIIYFLGNQIGKKISMFENKYKLIFQ